MSLDARDIERRVIELAKSFAGQLPEEDIENTTSLAAAGEWGIALENLTTQLYEYDVGVTPDTYEEIARLGKAMGISEEYWTILRIESP